MVPDNGRAVICSIDGTDGRPSTSCRLNSVEPPAYRRLCDRIKSENHLLPKHLHARHFFVAPCGHDRPSSLKKVKKVKTGSVSPRFAIFARYKEIASMHGQTDNYTYLTQAPIPKVIFTMAVPTVISMLVTSIYNLADTFFVGRIDTQATAAVGVVFDDVLRAGRGVSSSDMDRAIISLANWAHGSATMPRKWPRRDSFSRSPQAC